MRYQGRAKEEEDGSAVMDITTVLLAMAGAFIAGRVWGDLDVRR